MVTGTDGDTVLVKETADIIGMMLAQIESNHPGAIGWAIHYQIRHLQQRFLGIVHQPLLIAVDTINTQFLDITQRRTKPYHAGRIRRTRFKTPRRFKEGGALAQANGTNHRTAALPWWHLVQ